MALVGTLVDTRTVAAAATASGTFTHGIGLAPHIVFAVPVYATGSLSTTFPYFAAQMDSASVTFFNRGTVAETFSVHAIRLHTIIQ